MKLNKIVEKLSEKYSLKELIGCILETQSLDKLLLLFSNECVYLSQAAKDKKEKKKWYGIARILHRARDEMILKNKPFEITRKDTYECSKCHKKFQVDPFAELNTKFDVNEGIYIASCPECGLSEK